MVTVETESSVWPKIANIVEGDIVSNGDSITIVGTGFKDGPGQLGGLYICDTSTFSGALGCSTTEIQTVDDWRSEGYLIFATVVQGSTFGDGDPAFMHVVNAFGVENVAGHPITFLGSTATTTVATTTSSIPAVNITGVAGTVENGQQLVISGTGFGATQGQLVSIANAYNPSDWGSTYYSGQTIDAWADTEITITVVKGAHNDGDNVWLYVWTNLWNTDDGWGLTFTTPVVIPAISGFTGVFGETGAATVAGTDFLASQGFGSVEIRDAGGNKTQGQTITSWGDTSIVIQMIMAPYFTQGETAYLYVTNNDQMQNVTGHSFTFTTTSTIPVTGSKATIFHGSTIQ